MAALIKNKKGGIKVLCSNTEYRNKLVELNKNYPGRVWVVLTTGGNKFKIDLRDKRYRSITI